MSDDPGFLLRGIPEADEFENVYEALASPPAMHDGERLLPPVQRHVASSESASLFTPNCQRCLGMRI